MFTLHSLSKNIHTILKWCLIVVGILLFLFLGYKMFGFVQSTFFPKPAPPPTVAFGKLPTLVFPKSAIASQSFHYTVDTVSGKLPTFSDRTNIYPITHSKPNFLNLEKAKNKISALGFTKGLYGGETAPARAISESLYEWTDVSDLKRRIIMDINTFSFSLTSQYITNESVLNARLIADEKYAQNIAEKSLSSIGLLPQDIDPEKTKTELYRIQNSVLVPSESLSNTQVIRVDLFQKDLNTIPIYYPDPPHSNMNFLIASGQNDSVIVQANFTYQKIEDTSATYPIKTIEEAFKDLQEGKAYIGSYFGSSTEILIKDVKLGYFLGITPQEYVMPVIVFTGNNGFIAYVSAITDNWTE